MGDAERAVPRMLVAGTVHRKARMVLTALPLTSVRANPSQPRQHFDNDALAELAASITQHGILQPVIVKHTPDGFMIMAGERRYRAAQIAGLTSIPALVRDDDPMEIGIIENLQRENLSPLEEAEGLGALIDQYGYTHEALAELIGKSRPYVSNTLALRRLPDPIKRAYHETPDVSREILISVARAPSPEKQDMLWRMARLRKLSVQRFRSEQAGEPAGRNDVVEVARTLRRLGRRLRALDTEALVPTERQRLERLLRRTQARIMRTLAAIAPARE